MNLKKKYFLIYETAVVLSPTRKKKFVMYVQVK